jgi:predicted phage tail protein
MSDTNQVPIIPAPFKDPLVDSNGNLTKTWTRFFQSINVSSSEVAKIVENLGVVSNLDPTLITALTTESLIFAIKLNITCSSLPENAVIEVWESDSQDRSHASLIAETAVPYYVRTSLPLITTKYYWVRIKDIQGGLGPYFPADQYSGIVGTTSRDPSMYLDLLTDSIGKSQLTAELITPIEALPESVMELVLTGDTARTENRIATLIAEEILGQDGTTLIGGKIYDERLVRVSAEGAIASSVSSLSSTVGGHTTSISTNASAISTVDGNLRAQYVLKLNVNSRVAGFGLALSDNDPSEFIILADKFSIVSPSDNGKVTVPFTVGNIGGVSTVGVNGNMIIDGSVLARNIAASAITADKVGTNEIIANVANIKDALITGAKIANATIANANIVDATIENGKIANATIETGKIKDLQVTTIKIADQAVTIPLSVYASNTVALGTKTWDSVLSLAITSTGAPTMVLGFGIFYYRNGYDAGIKITRDSTDISYYFAVDSAGCFALTIADTPGAGNHTYYLKMYEDVAGQYAFTRSLLILETKK